MLYLLTKFGSELNKKKLPKYRNGRRLTSGFTRAGVYVRPNFCADLRVQLPPKLFLIPRPREAAERWAQARKLRRIGRDSLVAF
jgi:hypothetical protein